MNPTIASTATPPSTQIRMMHVSLQAGSDERGVSVADADATVTLDAGSPVTSWYNVPSDETFAASIELATVVDEAPGSFEVKSTTRLPSRMFTITTKKRPVAFLIRRITTISSCVRLRDKTRPQPLPLKRTVTCAVACGAAVTGAGVDGTGAVLFGFVVLLEFVCGSEPHTSHAGGHPIITAVLELYRTVTKFVLLFAFSHVAHSSLPNVFCSCNCTVSCAVSASFTQRMFAHTAPSHSGDPATGVVDRSMYVTQRLAATPLTDRTRLSGVSDAVSRLALPAHLNTGAGIGQ
mmetsp:Transcript_2149/g.5397  ORF Transcript_2149/g.5397 Transcript_2149/m.5397 type:complete len:292 (+) Transcript_2149:386-1261(+)